MCFANSVLIQTIIMFSKPSDVWDILNFCLKQLDFPVFLSQIIYGKVRVKHTMFEAITLVTHILKIYNVQEWNKISKQFTVVF